VITHRHAATKGSRQCDRLRGTAVVLTTCTPSAAPAPFPAALERIYREQAPSLVRLLTRYVGVHASAEDLTHETFVRVCRAWPRIEKGPRVDAYVRTVAINLALSALRRNSSAERCVAQLPAETQSAEAEALSRDDRQRLLAAITRLPPRQQQCLALRYWESLPEAEVGARLGISRNSVKTHLRRALGELRDLLGPRERTA
jgi:RNA polymerase sigma-70 factor (sigma-E family)